MRYRTVATSLGPVVVAGDDDGIRQIELPSADRGGGVLGTLGWIEGGPPVDEAARQLEEYFAGTRRRFELPLAPEGTPFQRRVWDELTRIPYGETITYGELARRVGSAGGFRAVGGANGANPIPIVIPCHRVVAAGGKLGGFSGGLPLKRALLALESRELRLVG